MKTHSAAPPSVPSGKGEKVERSITIDRPVAEVFSFWRRLENLPRFLHNLVSVVEHDANRSRWTAKGPGEKLVHWEAELIEERQNEMLSWRSLPGSQVDNAGSVWFASTPDNRGTNLKVALKYSPPAGKIGLAIAKLWHRDADSEIEANLLRLKNLLEKD
jgi:uncharacterized membrane protein